MPRSAAVIVAQPVVNWVAPASYKSTVDYVCEVFKYIPASDKLIY